MNVSERISEHTIGLAKHNVNRINDNVIKGFHVRFGKLNNDGSRLVSYYFFYRIGGRNGRQVNYFIGNSQSMDAGLARRIALQIEAHLQAGSDIEKMKFEAEKEQVKVKGFWRYLGRDFVLNKYKNGLDVCRLFEQYILPQIGSIQLTKLSHRLIKLRVVDPLIAKDQVSLARSVISYLKQLLQHSVSNNYLTTMPLMKFDVLAINPNVINKDDRVHLTGPQIKGIYYRASKANAKSTYLFTLRLQILSGQSLAVICRSYRQDIKGNKWLLRDINGKLNGKTIPLDGPLKALLKQGVKEFSNPASLYLLPGKGRRKDADRPIDSKSLAKHQKCFIDEVQGVTLSMSQFLIDIELSMIEVGVNPLVVAYLFHKKTAPYLQLSPDDPLIAQELQNWYLG